MVIAVSASRRGQRTRVARNGRVAELATTPNPLAREKLARWMPPLATINYAVILIRDNLIVPTETLGRYERILPRVPTYHGKTFCCGRRIGVHRKRSALPPVVHETSLVCRFTYRPEVVGDKPTAAWE